VLRRALTNAGLLSSGQLAAGLMQIATFALATRGLGLADFGFFSMLLAQVQVLTDLAAFKSNQAVISYGVGHLQKQDMRAFQALIKTGMLLDIAAAGIAMMVTVIIAPLIGGALGWSADMIFDAQLIAPLALINTNATPKGMLRLFGRFDLLTLLSIVIPTGRLLGVGLAYILGAPIRIYLILWFIAGLLGVAVAMWLGFREAHRRGCLAGMDWSLRHLRQENKGVWRFSLVANLHSTMAMVPGQLSIFLVGAILDPAAAGLFKIAREIGSGIAKPVDLINQAVYPDIARLVASREWRRLKRTVIGAGAVAAGISGLVTALIAVVGGPLLAAIFGRVFADAAPVLVLMSLATTVMVMTFAVDPMMYALGRPGRLLITSILATVIFLAILWWRLPVDGLIGAGWAYLAMSACTFVMSTIWALHSVPATEKPVLATD
jgi:O-antigen/teichoic acid export membrane protein